MDQLRRKILLGSSALPLGLILPGCGGGGDSSATAAGPGAGGRASPQGTKPTNIPSIAFKKTSASAALDPVFTDPTLAYLVSNTQLVQAIYSTALATMYIKLVEVITPPGSSVIHHRTLSLALPNFSTAPNAQNNYPPGSGYGPLILVINTIDTSTGAVKHYEYDASSGGVVLATNGSANSFQLALSLTGAPKTAQAFSSPQASVNLKTGSNSAVNSVLINSVSTASDGAGSGLLNITYGTESGGWI